MRIYVASSWRNKLQPDIVKALRAEGHNVYDFRNPRDENDGFHWTSISPTWQDWSPEEFRAALRHPIAEHGYNLDLRALNWCDVCLLVMPCGRSAHLELGYCIGTGAVKTSIILLSDGEPELMYKLADYVCLDLEEVKEVLRWEEVCPKIQG